jgi:hypothetical protein
MRRVDERPVCRVRNPRERTPVGYQASGRLVGVLVALRALSVRARAPEAERVKKSAPRVGVQPSLDDALREAAP